jgi:type I restriction enzyme S subunit
VSPEDYFAGRLGSHGLAPLIAPELARIFRWFQAAGLCETKFQAEVSKGTYGAFAQDVSEMLVAYRLHQGGFTLARSPPAGGPDFIASRDGQVVQLEVVTPEPVEKVRQYQERPRTGEFLLSVPAQEFLLCWTKGIAQKAHQLLGNGELAGWRSKGLVREDLPFVIVVNGCQFSGSFDEGFRPLRGPFPLAARALYAISEFTIEIDKATGKSVGSGFNHHPQLDRGHDRGPVPLDTFLDPQFAPVSAVWAVSLNQCDLRFDLGEKRNVFSSAVIHNPSAHVPLPQGLLPAFEEWTLTQGQDENTLHCVINRVPLPEGAEQGQT